MSENKRYYECYWKQGTDVSDGDVTTQQRKRSVLETLAFYLKPSDKVLDLGCGGGQFTQAISEAGYETSGADISERSLDLARKRFPGGHFFLLNPEGTIPSPDEIYAAVWCSEVIEHILDVNSFLLEIRRVLKPGGVLILTTPYHGFLKNLLIVLLKFDRHFDPEGPHIRFFDRKGLERCLGKNGFTPVSFQGIGRIWKMYRTSFVVSKKIII
jgi:2-polyprenyl-3-methyl-5-hydroxy-6-metoxy-1,4-benzoquinol methylase